MIFPCRSALRLTLVTFLAIVSARAQEKEKEQTPQEKWVHEMADRARDEIRAYRQLKKPQTEHPGKKWGELFWEYYLSHGNTPATRAAASQSFWMFYEADLEPEVFARAERMEPEDPAWEEAIAPFYRAADYRKQLPLFIARAKLILEESSSKDIRAEVQYHLAMAYMNTKEKDLAQAAFEAVAKEAPGSDRAKKAERHLFELLHINVGQPAPGFRVAATDGKMISLDDYRGKVVLLNFWASW